MSDEPRRDQSAWIQCWNPIGPDEREHLRSFFGRELRQIRLAGNWSQARFANLVPLSATYVSHLENGRRRPRRSTIERIIAAAIEARPELGDPARLIEALCAAAGTSLAPETKYPVEMERTRQRRARRRERERRWFAGGSS